MSRLRCSYHTRSVGLTFREHCSSHTFSPLSCIFSKYISRIAISNFSSLERSIDRSRLYFSFPFVFSFSFHLNCFGTERNLLERKREERESERERSYQSISLMKSSKFPRNIDTFYSELIYFCELFVSEISLIDFCRVY